MMFNYNWQKKAVSITPIVATMVFLFLGFGFDLWHPGWLAYLLVPLMPFLVGLKKIQITFSLVIFITYLILGIGFNYWHPGWIIFFLIPIYHIITAPNPQDRIKDKRKNTIDAEFDSEEK